MRCTSSLALSSETPLASSPHSMCNVQMLFGFVESLWDGFPKHSLACVYNACMQVLYNIGKVVSDAGDAVLGEAAYREAIR